ncbi:MAG: rRNA maturation RNase YbeY [Lachnospiraceae bacterium]|nr:rRNA maturation RNase YbeY [Lachnospiraceae bacterium]
MTIFFENNTEEPIAFDYETLIRQVMEKTLQSEKCPFECEVNLTLTTNEEIRQINQEYRQLDVPTDVLSFPMAEFEVPGDFSRFADEEIKSMYFNLETEEFLLGDIVISIERAKEQAEEYGHTLEREIAFLTAHSMLHLMGYDHMEDEERIIMERKQEKILQDLGITRDT